MLHTARCFVSKFRRTPQSPKPLQPPAKPGRCNHRASCNVETLSSDTQASGAQRETEAPFQTSYRQGHFRSYKQRQQPCVFQSSVRGQPGGWTLRLSADAGWCHCDAPLGGLGYNNIFVSTVVTLLDEFAEIYSANDDAIPPQNFENQ